MCGSMADIQSAAAEIRRGKKDRTNHSMKIYMVSLLHRATIKKVGAYVKHNARRTSMFHKAVVAQQVDTVGGRHVQVKMLQIQQRSKPHARFNVPPLNTSPHIHGGLKVEAHIINTKLPLLDKNN